MLVLTLKPGIKINIGHDVEIVLCGTKGQKASIGIQAPADVRIRRDEPGKEKAA